MIAFQIGGENSEFIRVSVTRVSRHELFSTDVEVAVGHFRGSYRADFESYAFSEFHKQLAILNKTVSGSAVFTSREGQLELTLKCDDLGHIHVSGEAMDLAGTGNRLLFELGIDQTHIPKILNSLKSTLESI